MNSLFHLPRTSLMLPACAAALIGKRARVLVTRRAIDLDRETRQRLPYLRVDVRFAGGARLLLKQNNRAPVSELGVGVRGRGFEPFHLQRAALDARHVDDVNNTAVCHRHQHAHRPVAAVAGRGVVPRPHYAGSPRAASRPRRRTIHAGTDCHPP
jgi:hypothetical protein